MAIRENHKLVSAQIHMDLYSELYEEAKKLDISLSSVIEMRLLKNRNNKMVSYYKENTNELSKIIMRAIYDLENTLSKSGLKPMFAMSAATSGEIEDVIEYLKRAIGIEEIEE